MNPFEKAVKSIKNIFSNDANKLNDKLREEKLQIEDLIFLKGYPLEIHNVITEDGYQLRIYRIPGDKDEDNYKEKLKDPVLFQHGLFDSSDGWVCNSEDKCLPFIMANNGYDVWISNSRGNKHSKYHEKFSPVSYEFWSYSFHDMGLYDIPAILDHIYRINSSKRKIIYIGHSQGTCMMFAALTMKLDYFQQMIKVMVALAPVSRVANLKSNFLKFLEKIKFDKLLKSMKQYEVFPNNESNNDFNAWMNSVFPSISHGLIDMISDENSKKINNKERMGIYLSHYPAGCSLKSLNHFLQIYRSKKFVNYDYGKEANMHIYKSLEPPEYNLDNITNFKFIFISGGEDKLSSTVDVDWLHSKLVDKNIFLLNKSYSQMGHISFLMGNDVSWFREVLDVLKYVEE
jgi:lysosomal acid lipase/cholesteryl ester hydrolase